MKYRAALTLVTTVTKVNDGGRNQLVVEARYPCLAQSAARSFGNPCGTATVRLLKTGIERWALSPFSAERG
jgi:hypothetical protein